MTMTQHRKGVSGIASKGSLMPYKSRQATDTQTGVRRAALTTHVKEGLLLLLLVGRHGSLLDRPAALPYIDQAEGAIR